MIRRSKSQSGLIKLVLLIIVILIVLGYFGLNLREIIDSQTFQDNWSFIKEIFVGLWNNILKTPVTFIWDAAIKPLLASISK